MKKFYLIALAGLSFLFGNSQINVSVNPDPTDYVGFIEAFNASDDSFAFGFPYPVADLKTEFPGTTVVIKQNFKIWVDEANNPDYFDNPGNPPSNPNKKVDCLSFLQASRSTDPDFFTQDVNFYGDITSFDIDEANYVVRVFIRVFNSDYSVFREYEQILSSTDTSFLLTAPGGDFVATDEHLQGGYSIYGLIADPALENTSGYGGVTFRDPALTVETFNQSSFNAFPNPAKNNWTINANSKIINIQLYDVLGHKVLHLNPNITEVSIDASNFSEGIYFARLESENGAKTIKLIKE